MLNAIERALQAALDGGADEIGEIAIQSSGGDGFSLCHCDDRTREDLQIFGNPEDAIELGRYDNAGKYRPLKTAPNLRVGWRLQVPNLSELARALDQFYPGRLAALLAWNEHHLGTTPLRETLNRQTGMYRIAAKISDEQLDEVVGNFCRSNGRCLRTILWKRDEGGTTPSTRLPPAKFDPNYDQTGKGESAVPLLCQEACNLLVNECRKAVTVERAAPKAFGADLVNRRSPRPSLLVSAIGLRRSSAFVYYGVTSRPPLQKKMILRARTVVTMDGPPIGNGAVAIVDDRIADVGTFEEVNAQTTGEIFDLGERTLLPGLINGHCHLDYTCLRGKIPPQKSFTDWIRAINAEKAKLSADDYVASIEAGFTEAKKFGSTTVANLTAFPELISRITPPIRTWWFPELIDVRDPSSARENLIGLTDQVSKSSNATTGGWGLAPHALFTASRELFRRCADVAPILTTHLAESREEMEMFRDASGSLYDFLKEIGRDMSDCGGKTPVEEFLGRGGSPNRSEPDGRSWAIGVNRPYLLVHMNELIESDFDLLARLPATFSIVHCPRSHDYFGHSAFQFARLREAGFNISLGTDSLASNNDLSLFSEMRAFLKTYRDVSPEEILSLVTVNGARALGRSDVLGRIRSGFLADLIAIPASSGRSIFDEIVAFEGEPWAMIGGNGSEA